MKTFYSYFVASYITEGVPNSSDSDDDTDKNCTKNSDTKVAITVFSTENVLERTGGLLRLPPLVKDQGLLINKCNSVHTFGMGYSLDVVYLNRHLKVVKLVANLKPRRMSLCLRAKHTLELVTGEISRLGITDDMTLIFDDKK